MDLATTLSIVALGVSVAAAGFTGWQAAAQHRTYAIERERRRDERTPVFKARLREFYGKENLRLELSSPWTVDQIVVEILEGSFSFYLKGSLLPIFIRAWPDEVTQGQTMNFQIDRSFGTIDSKSRLKVQCQDGREPYIAFVDVDLPTQKHD
jgi:hypothetical protein